MNKRVKVFKNIQKLKSERFRLESHHQGNDAVRGKRIGIVAQVIPAGNKLTW